MPYVENTDLTQFWRQEHGSTVSFFPFPFSKSKGIIKSGHFYLPSTSISSPSSKADAWAFIWPMIGNVQLLPILSTALSPVLWYIQEKNHLVLVEWILIALHASHFNLTAVEVYESNLFVFIFRFWAYLSIHIHVTSCQEDTNTTSKGSEFNAFFTSVSLPLLCRTRCGSHLLSVWARCGSHLLWRMSIAKFQNPAQRWHFFGEAMLSNT